MLTDCQNSFTSRFIIRFATKTSKISTTP